MNNVNMNDVKQMIDLISGRGDGVNVATMGARDAGYYACSTFSECVDYVRQYSDNILAEDIGGQEVPVLTDEEVTLVVLGLGTVEHV